MATNPYLPKQPMMAKRPAPRRTQGARPLPQRGPHIRNNLGPWQSGQKQGPWQSGIKKGPWQGGKSPGPWTTMPVPGGNHTTMPVPGGPGDTSGQGPGTDYTGGLPLDPYYEAQRRMIQDNFERQKAMLDPLRAQIAAMQAQESARLNTNEGVDTKMMLEQLAGRGALQGGVEAQDRGQLGTDYLRMRQDLANQIAGRYSDVAMQEGEMYNSYNNSLLEALMESANRSAYDPNSPIPYGGQNTPGQGGGQGGGGGKGGGKGGKKPPRRRPKPGSKVKPGQNRGPNDGRKTAPKRKRRY